MNNTATVAFLGLVGWYEEGRDENCTFTRLELSESELTAPIRVDLRPVLESSSNPIATVWNRPNLNLNLPNKNVRNLFEGCVGYEGSTDGHPWDGDLSSLQPTDSVGLDVYLAVLESQGASIVRV